MSPLLALVTFLAAQGTRAQPLEPVPANPIDAYFEARWKKDGVRPSPASDDSEFLRRITIDVMGRLPTAGEVRAFLADPAADRRGKLVERQLRGEESAAFFGDAWMYALIENDMAPRDVQRVDFAAFRTWLKSRFYEDAPYVETVRALLSDRGGRREKPAVNYGLKHLADEPLPVKLATASTRFFLGKDIRCAQCHDHPFDEMTREEFWGFVEFFRPIRNAGDQKLIELENPRRGALRDDMGELQGLSPRFIDGRLPESGKALGVAMADLFLSTKDRDVSRAAVNRVWRHFFGRRLADPKLRVQPHAELMDRLVDEFDRSGHSLRKLMAMIATSKVYGRSSIGAEDTRLAYAAGPIKPLGAVQFLNIYTQVFDVEEYFRKAREIAYKDPKFADKAKDEDVQRMQFIQWSRDLLIPKGHDPEEAPAIGTVRMAIKFMNNRNVNSMMISQWGTLKKILEAKSRTGDRVDELYLSLLSRLPSTVEKQEAVEFVEERLIKENSFEDLLWTLVNSSEFMFNH